MFSELFYTFWRYSLLINSSRNIYFPAPSHGNGYIALPQEKPYYFDDILLINALRKVCFLAESHPMAMDIFTLP